MCLKNVVLFNYCKNYLQKTIIFQVKPQQQMRTKCFLLPKSFPLLCKCNNRIRFRNVFWWREVGRLRFFSKEGVRSERGWADDRWWRGSEEAAMRACMKKIRGRKHMSTPRSELGKGGQGTQTISLYVKSSRKIIS